MTRVVSRLYTDYLPPTEAGWRQHDPLVGGGTSSIDSPRNSGISMMPTDAEDAPTAKAPHRPVEGKKSKRIFVARIPSRVSEEEFRKHFEEHGVIEDAYRPKDYQKNMFRGIGFVTFADVETVDRVLGMKHVLGGAEVVVERATPRHPVPEEKDASKATQPVGESVEESIPQVPSTEAMANNDASTASLFGSTDEPSFDWNSFNFMPSGTYPNSTANNNRGPPSNVSDDFGTVPQASLDVHESVPLRGGTKATTPIKMSHSASADPGRKNGGVSVPSATTLSAAKTTADNSAHVRKVRGGPRIFVGKLSKDTVEQDLADYFSQFGYVMDVYIPRSRDNKKDHRGFGFVTFETEASIKRAVSQGTHRLKGAVLAIDIAVPEASLGN